jgi:hypothetical protein
MTTVDDAFKRLRERADNAPEPWTPDEDEPELAGIVHEIWVADIEFRNGTAHDVPHVVIREYQDPHELRLYRVTQGGARKAWDEQQPVLGDAVLIVYRGEKSSRSGNTFKDIDIYVERLNAESVEDPADPWPDFDEPGEPDPPNNTQW